MPVFDKRKQVHTLIEQNRAKHLERIREYMAQPSVAIENQGVEECAELLCGYYKQLGCQEAEVVQTPGFPGVWAYYDAGAPKTLAVYGYFDTNVVGSGWEHPVYEAALGPKGDFKEVVFGRGAGSKGAYAAFLNALEDIIAVQGNLPVNLMFLSEGDEFLGSNNIPFLIERYRDRLSKADALFAPKPCQTASGDVTLFLAGKGCLHVELKCSGEQWGKGPIGGTVHSSVQNVLDSPVWRLVHALASMYDDKQNRILMDGFYEGLYAPTEEEIQLVEILAEKFKGKEVEAIPALGNRNRVKQFINNETGKDLLLRYSFQPTMNINGIRGGFTGPGTLLWTLPHEAYATVDFRLPYNLDPHISMEKMRKHLDERGYSDITIKPLETSTGDIPLTMTDELMQAPMRVFKEWGVQPVVWPRRGAGGPTGFFSKMLGMKVLNSTGMGYASGHSDSNEYLVVEGDGKVGGLVELEQSYVDLMYSYAAYPEPF